MLLATRPAPVNCRQKRSHHVTKPPSAIAVGLPTGSPVGNPEPAQPHPASGIGCPCRPRRPRGVSTALTADVGCTVEVFSPIAYFSRGPSTNQITVLPTSNRSVEIERTAIAGNIHHFLSICHRGLLGPAAPRPPDGPNGANTLCNCRIAPLFLPSSRAARSRRILLLRYIPHLHLARPCPLQFKEKKRRTFPLSIPIVSVMLRAVNRVSSDPLRMC